MARAKPEKPPQSVENVTEPTVAVSAPVVPHQKPTVTRNVHYYPVVGEGPLAAIITKVHDDSNVELCVFYPSGLVFDGPRSAVASFAANPTPGCWSWPPRV